MTLIGATGGSQFEVDPTKSTESKMKALQTVEMKGLLEQWANGEIETADVQVMLLAFILSWTAVAAGKADRSGKIIVPGDRSRYSS